MNPTLTPTSPRQGTRAERVRQVNEARWELGIDPPRRSWPLGKYGLAIFFAALFLFTAVSHTIFNYLNYRHDTAIAGLPFVMSAWLVHLGDAIAENWQSEFLQLLFQVVATAYLIYEGATQSKDQQQRTDELLLVNIAETRLLRSELAYLRTHSPATIDRSTEVDDTIPDISYDNLAKRI